MSANGHCLGGEQSGHIIFSKNATTGDGILTSLKVMEAMLEKKQSLGKLASEVEIFPQVLKNVKVKDKKAAQDDVAVQAEVAKVTESLGDDGRILLRQSGTEPVVRVMVEAPSLEICEKYVDQVIQVMRSIPQHRFLLLCVLKELHHPMPQPGKNCTKACRKAKIFLPGGSF